MPARARTGHCVLSRVRHVSSGGSGDARASHRKTLPSRAPFPENLVVYAGYGRAICRTAQPGDVQQQCRSRTSTPAGAAALARVRGRPPVTAAHPETYSGLPAVNEEGELLRAIQPRGILALCEGPVRAENKKLSLMTTQTRMCKQRSRTRQPAIRRESPSIRILREKKAEAIDASEQGARRRFRPSRSGTWQQAGAE